MNGFKDKRIAFGIYLFQKCKVKNVNGVYKFNIFKAILILQNMEKIFNEFSIGLFIGQTFMFLVLIIVVFAIVKLYKKLMKYLDRK